jgi:hypothetical protein
MRLLNPAPEGATISYYQNYTVSTWGRDKVRHYYTVLYTTDGMYTQSSTSAPNTNPYSELRLGQRLFAACAVYYRYWCVYAFMVLMRLLLI